LNAKKLVYELEAGAINGKKRRERPRVAKMRMKGVKSCLGRALIAVRFMYGVRNMLNLCFARGGYTASHHPVFTSPRILTVDIYLSFYLSDV
jgi:hypothetical protein